MDKLSKERRSLVMSHVKSKDTKPEIFIRSLLHRAGYRFRFHVKGLPGKPDIVLPKYKLVVFVNGCFWHRHENCKRATMPIQNAKYWADKFKKNVERDKLEIKQLRDSGWLVTVIWECELQEATQRLLKQLCELSLGTRKGISEYKNEMH